MRIRPSLCLAALLFTLPAAQATETGPTLSLSETASVEVAQDELTARFYVERTGPVLADLNAWVGKQLARAQAAGTATARVTHKGLSTQAVYDRDGKTRDMTVRGVVEVRGTDLEAVSAVTAKLSAFMAAESVQFSVSQAKRKAAQDALAGEVALGLMRKARAVAASLGFKDVRVQQLALDTTLQEPAPQPMRAMKAMSATMAAGVDLGPAAAGTETVSTTMSGVLELRGE